MPLSAICLLANPRPAEPRDGVQQRVARPNERMRAVLEKPTLAAALSIGEADPDMKEMFTYALIASGRCFGEEPAVRLMREQAALERGAAEARAYRDSMGLGPFVPRENV